ncbi:MAG TPA: putative Ig domain-containing protein [Candidatus Krumholzibacteria bacterium]|nr:putative Ig domain-containing protein [Candidatus Krumholzibacteria bacterium]
MKKFVLMLGAAAIAIYGTYSLVSALQRPDEVSSGPAVTGGIAIAPPAAFVNTTLQARLEGKRGMGADPGACRWFVNDTEVAGVSASSLEPGHFKKGDRVRVEASIEGAALVSEPVVIANTPPRITMALAELKDAGGEIMVRISAVDADNDPITYSYEWFKNGAPVPSESGATIDVSRFQKGDNVYASVSASDGEASSSPRKSDSIKLGSNAPKITSTPPQALEEDRRFVYQVRVAQGSGSVKYELTEAPEGMVIDGNGRIEWTVPAHEDRDAKQEHKAVVRVTDSTGGWSTQEFRITTSIQAGLAE